MPRTTLPLLSLHAPYVRPTKWFGKDTRVEELLATTEVDLAMRERMIGMIQRWCLTNQFLIPANNTYVPNLSKADDDNVVNVFYRLNFRRLCLEEDLDKFSTYLQDHQTTIGIGTGDLTTNKLINLIVELGTAVPVRTINQYINNLYQTLHAMSDEGWEDMHSWAHVHDTFPFAWVIHAIQTVLHAFTPPREA